MTPEKTLENDRISIANIGVWRDNLNTAVKSINNIIFVVSTGTFAISISFIGYFQKILNYPWLLILTWAFLLIAICGNVAVLFLTSKIAEKWIKDLNDYRQSSFTPHWNMGESRNPRVKVFYDWSWWITYVVFSSIILGLLTLFLFCSINLLSRDNSNKETLGNKEPSISAVLK